MLAIKESLVQDIQNLSDSQITRLRITFKNGRGLSIIRGEGTMGFSENLFELATITAKGEFSSVEGYKTEEDVREYIERVSKY